MRASPPARCSPGCPARRSQPTVTYSWRQPRCARRRLGWPTRCDDLRPAAWSRARNKSPVPGARSGGCGSPIESRGRSVPESRQSTTFANRADAAPSTVQTGRPMPMTRIGYFLASEEHNPDDLVDRPSAANRQDSRVCGSPTTTTRGSTPRASHPSASASSAASHPRPRCRHHGCHVPHVSRPSRHRRPGPGDSSLHAARTVPPGGRYGRGSRREPCHRASRPGSTPGTRVHPGPQPPVAFRGHTGGREAEPSAFFISYAQARDLG